MPDYAFMSQCLYEGKAKEVEQMTKDALTAEGSIAAGVEFIKSCLSVSKRVGERGRRDLSTIFLAEASEACLLSGGTLTSRIIQNA